MYRQHRLTSVESPLELVTVIDESALHRTVGGIDVLRAQLAHLAALAELDTVTLHVLPASVGAHAGLASGFTILNFGGLGEPDMAYVEHSLGALSLDKDGDVARARLDFRACAVRRARPGRVTGADTPAGWGLSPSEGEGRG